MKDGPQISAKESAKETPSLDLTGRVLDDFRILRRLGQGGMGQVYLAEQLSLHRKVALKVLRPELAAANPTALKRFKGEAAAVARLPHANIVQVYAIGEAEGYTYMALEYVEGRNLREYLSRKGSPDILGTLSIMRQVASALHRASEMGIIHRDIKPENILITRKGTVKVADFGLARILTGDHPPQNLTQSGVTMGTPLYMSPEQVEGKTIDCRTDIYSFGITCYHMLAGNPPFRGSTPFEVALQHVRGEAQPLTSIRPDLPPALCAVVHKMMARDPAQRYQTGRELLKDLARIRESLSGQTSAAPLSITVPPVSTAPALTPTAGPGAPDTTRVPVPRFRWLGMATLVLSLGLACSGGALLAWYQRRANHPQRPPLTPLSKETLKTRVLDAPQQTLQQKVDVVDQYLLYPQKILDQDVVFQTSLDLAIDYLENGELKKAHQLFTRMEDLNPRMHRSLYILGQLGQGVVLALENKPTESNQKFDEVFGRFLHKVNIRRILDGRGKQPLEFLLWRDPRWRYWASRALFFNYQNGLPEEQVPAGLRRLLFVKPGLRRG